jgi:non-ribosomal peptide synthetase component E (peptide arylation enzyme)
MILPSPTPRLTAGAGLTLDRLLQKAASRHADQIAVIDPPNRGDFTAGPPLALTYAEVDRAVTAIAARLCGLGLAPDHVIGLQLPNSAEGVLALMGALRAGLIVSPLPLLWRRADCAAALARIGARAFVTASRIGATDHGEIAMYAAADAFTVGHVLLFGGSRDGMLTLDDALAEPAPSFAPVERGSDAAAHVAVITWDTDAAGPMPVARSHAELVLAGLEIMLEAKLAAGSAILSSLCLGSTAGIAASLVAVLLSRGTLVLHQPFDAAVMRRQLIEHRCAAAVVPGSLAARMAQSGMFGDSTLGSVIAIWRTPERLSAAAAWPGPAALTDVVVFGETGLVAAAREPEEPLGIKPGPSRHDNARAPILIEVARSETGNVALRGPMVALHRFPVDGAAAQRGAAAGDAEGFVDTLYPCRFAPGTDRLVITGPPAGIASVGGYRFAMASLQEAVSGIAPAAKIAAFPDALTGQRIAGMAPDRASLRQSLAMSGHNPLLANAFRPRASELQSQ